MFFTIPDINNVPVMLNLGQIESIQYMEDFTMKIALTSGDSVMTSMPRQILVQMINKLSNKPETVITHTEFAG